MRMAFRRKLWEKLTRIMLRRKTNQNGIRTFKTLAKWYLARYTENSVYRVGGEVSTSTSPSKLPVCPKNTHPIKYSYALFRYFYWVRVSDVKASGILNRMGSFLRLRQNRLLAPWGQPSKPEAHSNARVRYVIIPAHSPIFLVKKFSHVTRLTKHLALIPPRQHPKKTSHIYLHLENSQLGV